MPFSDDKRLSIIPFYFSVASIILLLLLPSVVYVALWTYNTFSFLKHFIWFVFQNYNFLDINFTHYLWTYKLLLYLKVTIRKWKIPRQSATCLSLYKKRLHMLTTWIGTPKSISGRRFFEDITLTINEVLKRKRFSEYLWHNNACWMIPWHHCLD